MEDTCRKSLDAFNQPSIVKKIKNNRTFVEESSEKKNTTALANIFLY